MFPRLLSVLLVLGAGGCATAPRPDPALGIDGEWSVVAVNGVATGGGESFWFTLYPPEGSAQFGCNAGGGTARVDRGWLITGNWIITAAGCRNERLSRFERQGFIILGEPAAIEPHPGGLRLRNRRGSIALRPLPPPVLAGTWAVISVNETPLGYPSAAQIKFAAADFSGGFGCNWFRGDYKQDGRTLRVGQAAMTERGCVTAAGEPAPSMALENAGLAILTSSPAIRRVRRGVVSLTSPRGTLLLQRE